MKRQLLKAYIQGKADEIYNPIIWNELPWIGKYRRIKLFLIWYNEKYNTY